MPSLVRRGPSGPAGSLAGAFADRARLPFRVAAPSLTRLPLDEARVFFAEPSRVLRDVGAASLLELLCAEELERHALFHFPEDRELFLVSHALVRVALTNCADVPAAAWEFVRTERGRPEIGAPSSGLRFSLSHTPGLAVCAVAHHLDIGIDAEDATVPPPFAVARRFFAPNELHRLEVAPESQRARLFFEYWTHKEAYSKAKGFGLTLPLSEMVFREAEGVPGWRLSQTPFAGDDPRLWRFHSGTLCDRFCVTLAVPSRRRELRVVTFQLA